MAINVSLGREDRNRTQDSIFPLPCRMFLNSLCFWDCPLTSFSGSRQWGLYAGLFLGGIVVAIMVLEVVILLSRRRGKANHYQSTMEEKSLTIYAQVQKSGPLQKTPETPVTQDPCTTIYVAAAEPVPESVQEPNPITVYASVTLPESWHHRHSKGTFWRNVEEPK